MSALPKLYEGEYLVLSCEPEIFVRKNKKLVLGNDIPKDTTRAACYGITSPLHYQSNGILVKLKTCSAGCRANLGNDISEKFIALRKKLDKEGATIDFSSIVRIPKKQLDKLDPTIKKLSLPMMKNIYNDHPEDITLSNYRVANGNITLCGQINDDDIVNLVKLLDIFVGNTAVLLDRNPKEKERRKYCSRAGDYLKTNNGLTYGGVSNFWLKRYEIFSLMFGLTRFAYCINKNIRHYESVFDLVDMNDIRKAINTNNYRLAKKNFDKVKQFIIDITEDNSDFFPLWKSNMECFEYIAKNGYEELFNINETDYWTTSYKEGHDRGWESFSLNNIHPHLYGYIPPLGNIFSVGHRYLGTAYWIEGGARYNGITIRYDDDNKKA